MDDTLEQGRVVRSLRGRDKGSLLAVMRVEGGRVYVCDGKERPIDRPKAKNIRHIELTAFTVTQEEMLANGRLRRALGRIDG